MKKNKGFTLIELLAVLVILAIIALIITPIVTNLIKDSRIKASEDAAKGLLSAVDVFYGRAIMNTDGVFNSNGTVKLVFGTDGTVSYKSTTGATVTGLGAELEYDGAKVLGGEVQVDRYGTKYITEPLRINGYYCARPANGSTKVKCREVASDVTVDTAP